MRRSLRYAALFLLILLVLCHVLDYLVSTGLRKTEMPRYKEWNAILDRKAEADIIIQGSSRAWVGLSPSIIGGRLGMTCYNLAIDGYTLDMELARYRLYRKYDGEPKLILQTLDDYSLNIRDDLYQNNQFLPYLSEGIIRDAVKPYHYFKWYDFDLPFVRYRGKLDLIGRGLAELFGIHHYVGANDRGYQAQDLKWTNDFAEFVAANPNGVEYKHLQSVEDALDDFLAECGRDGIMVVLVCPPEYAGARDMVNNREEIFAIYRRLAAKHGVPFLDYSYDPMADDTTYFYNSQHLNKLGSELFSAKLADDLAGLMQGAETATAAR